MNSNQAADPSPYQYPYPPPSLLHHPVPQHALPPSSFLPSAAPASNPYAQPPPQTEPDLELGTAYRPSPNLDPKAVRDADAEEARILARTPSPTPSEEKALKNGALDWEMMKNWRFWIRREWLWYYVALFIILTLTALIAIFHTQIVDWLTPFTKWLYKLKFGWLVPIGILFVISFPPLFGHEIVAMLCGLVWGLWVGFAIVSAGTFIGEVGNFYAFKYCCRARGAKMERTNLTYACLAKVVREGGFKIALIARLSAIPGHFTTAIFSTCGMNIFVFSIAAILSMPKQFITVYLGVILEQSATGVKDKKSQIISDVVLAITFLITLVAMWYIYHKMNLVRPQVIYERRKARQAKLARAGSFVSLSSSSDSHGIPLTLKVQPPSINEPRSSFDDHESVEEGYLYATKPKSKKGKLVKAPVPGYAFGPGQGHALGSPSGGNFPRGDRRGEQRKERSTDEVGWDMGGGAKGQVYGEGYVAYEAGESSETLTPHGLGHGHGHGLGEGSSVETLTQEGSWERFDSEGRVGGHGHGHAVKGTDGSYATAKEGSFDEVVVTPRPVGSPQGYLR